MKTKKNKNFKGITKDILIYGKQPILFAIKYSTRKFKQIYILKNNFQILKDFCQNNSINFNFNIVKIVDKNYIDSLFKEEVNTQGFVALVGEKKFLDFDYFLNKISKENILPKILILDSITDPHNVGAILRSAVAFGVEYIIVTAFNSAKDGAIIVKSSAGMSELVNFIEVVNLNNTIKDLQKYGYFIVGLDGDGKTTIDKVSNNNLALVLGSEGKGIRPLVKQNCDLLAKIPMKENVESLNVSVAAGIAMYSVWGKDV